MGQVATKIALPLLIFVFVAVSAGQKPATRRAAPDTPDKLIGFKVTGTTRYTDKEILGASGLQMGQPAAEGDFKEAVQRLGSSGMFSGVQYSFTSSNAGVKLDLQLSDVDPSKLVPAHFENFVWFTDAELLAALQTSVPLFKEKLPLTGNLPDRVSEALQSLLNEKHFPGRVDFLSEGDEAGGALHGIDYRVEEVRILIHAVEFPGASPEQAALLATASRRLTGREYNRAALSATARFDLLPVYLQRGYLKAAFGTPDARVSPQPAPSPDAEGPSEIQVDAIFPVVPGKVYATSSVDWKGNSVISTAEVAPLLHLPPRQPADAVRLLRDIESVSKVYRSRGYMTVQIKPDAQFDDEKSTVHYQLNVVEGDQYKMGELEILGLDTQATARMKAAWTLHEGQPYNADYPRKFLDDTRSLLPHGLNWAISTHETPDAKDKTVDVEIRFKQQ